MLGSEARARAGRGRHSERVVLLELLVLRLVETPEEVALQVLQQIPGEVDRLQQLENQGGPERHEENELRLVLRQAFSGRPVCCEVDMRHRHTAGLRARLFAEPTP